MNDVDLNDLNALAFIGGGNMAIALISGLTQRGLSGARIAVADPLPQALERLQADYGIRPAADNISAVNGAQVVILAVKPQFLRAVAEGGAYIRAHPDQAWADFVKLYPNDENALNLAAWRFTIGCFAADPFVLDVAKYKSFAEFLVKWGVIAKALPVGEYAVQLR